MQEIRFIKNYMNRFDNSVLEHAKILNKTITDTARACPDGIIYYTEPNGDKNFLYCVKRYYVIPKKINSLHPNDFNTNLNICFKIRNCILNDQDRHSIFHCYSCHMKCIEEYLSGRLQLRKRVRHNTKDKDQHKKFIEKIPG